MDIILALEKKYGKNHERYIHIMGVVKLAVLLAKELNADQEKARTAALLHDYYRYEDNNLLYSYLDEDEKQKYKGKYYMYHGLASAHAAKEIFGIKDEDILNAIRYHTSGRLGMSLLEEIIFLADFAEENRRYKDCDIVREKLEYGFYEAMYACIIAIKEHLISKKEDVSLLQQMAKEYKKKVGNK